MENLENKLVELIGKIEAAGSELAPEVIHLASASIFWDGIWQFVASVSLAALAAGFLKMWAWGISNSSAIVKERGERYSRDEEVPYFILGIGSIMAAVIMGVIAALNFFSGNFLLKIFNPEAALVKQLLL